MLHVIGGILVSESTVERVTETHGELLKQTEEAGECFVDEEWQWHEDRTGVRCGYVSIDATGVRIQGPDGTKRDGRMAYVGRVYNPSQRHSAAEKSVFSAGLCSLDQMANQLSRAAHAVGGDRVEQWIAVIDGGSGLSNALRARFPFCEVIIDFWHAKEYLVELSQELHPSCSERRDKWLSYICHRLKHHGGASVRRELEELELPVDRSTSVHDALGTALRYFTNYEQQMDYPEYVRRGWQIGSGPIESACKHLVKERLAGSGMRWSERGADAVCRLRALWNSPPSAWQAFWN